MNRIPVNLGAVLKKRFPQNLIFRYPFAGSFGFMLFCLVFVLIYEPLQTHPAQGFSYSFTMSLYCLLTSIPLFLLIKSLQRSHFFSRREAWTFHKEIIAVGFLIVFIGFMSFLAGFYIENPALRWNLPTLLDSMRNGLLIGGLPIIFLSLVNYRYLFVEETTFSYNRKKEPSATVPSEEIISIESRLKKESLKFLPAQLLYAESDANYVIFHLKDGDKIKKKMIRNSMQDIDKQLAAIPFFLRIHRGFLVNVKKVSSRKGNSLGYRLKLEGCENDIPVSRKNIVQFDLLMAKYQ